MTDRPTLFFAHANGFPLGSYQELFNALQGDYRITGPEQLGHSHDYPIAPNWQGLVDELLDELSSQTSEPVVGVGHSLGGVLTLMAAIQQPRRFRAFVMLDPPLVFGWTGLVIRMAKRFGFMDRLTPAGLSVGRRTVWPNREEAADYLRDKPLFRHFTEDCLHDYVNAATAPDDNGVRLTFDPTVEVEIFRHMPDSLAREPAPVRVPGAVVIARGSSVTRRPDLDRLRRRHHLTIREIEGGHMFPEWPPYKAATVIHETVTTLLASRESEKASA